MYLEEAEVKEYKRKNGTKYKQLHLGTNSKFTKKEIVAVVNYDVLKEFITKANPEFIEEIQETNKKLTSEKEKLEDDLQQVKKELEETESKSDVIKEKYFKLQNEKEELASELISEKETSKKLLASITNLTNEKKEIEKENIFLKSRSFFSRLINKQYVKEESVPEIVEAESSSTSKE